MLLNTITLVLTEREFHLYTRPLLLERLNDCYCKIISARSLNIYMGGKKVKCLHILIYITSQLLFLVSLNTNSSSYKKQKDNMSSMANSVFIYLTFFFSRKGLGIWEMMLAFEFLKKEIFIYFIKYITTSIHLELPKKILFCVIKFLIGLQFWK